jgi:hypothetical protein
MSNEIVKDLGKVVLKSIDEKALVAGALESVLEPALKKLVADTTNPFDDALLAMVYPQLKAYLLEEVEKLVAKIEA